MEVPPYDTHTAETDSIGWEVSGTFRLTRSPVCDSGSYHYELTGPDGQVIDSGMGNSLSDALLALAVGTEGKDV